MKDENWIGMMEKLVDIRLFCSLSLKKSHKGTLTSAQEVDMLFRVALAKQPIAPLELSRAMGASKTIVSRLIERLTEKRLIEKQYDRADKRSYSLKVTEQGKEELDRMYYYYLAPLYEMQNAMGKEAFRKFMEQIQNANEIMMQKKHLDNR